MIEINRNGLHFVDTETNKKILIENSEVLSFLREPIRGICNDFSVKDFINIFKQYESIFLIVPEFTEVFEFAETYVDYSDIDFEFVSMSIDSDIQAIEGDPFAKIYLSVQAVCKMTSDFICCFPASQLFISNIINSSLKISNKFHLSLELEDTEYRTHLPFNISQFTLFDFISAISNVLISATVREKSGVEDEFSIKKDELMELKKNIGSEIKIIKKNPVSSMDIEEETNKVLNDINNLLNNNKD
jgi:hypothetical protein